MDFFTLDISDNFSLDNDISSSYEFDSVSTLFNEKAARFILEDDNEKANEYIKQIFHINKKKKIKKHMKFFICEECGKIYKSKENTLLHYKNVHLNQKPYICNKQWRFNHRRLNLQRIIIRMSFVETDFNILALKFILHGI